MKRKGVINHGARVGDSSYGARRSGKAPGGFWVTQQHPVNSFPEGSSIAPYGPVGFSINGGIRAPSSYVGRSSAMSRTYTPFSGAFPKGNGGHLGTYRRGTEVFSVNSARVMVEGEQCKYIKPSTVSTQTMVMKKNHGTQYPCYWVQPTYPTSAMDQTASQGVYTAQKRVQSDTKADINNSALYASAKDDKCSCNNISSKSQNTSYVASQVLRSGQYGYTKTTHIPLDASVHLDRVQRRCRMPQGPQKPFPFAMNGNNGARCESDGCGTFPVAQIWYKTPPDWYWHPRRDANVVCDGSA